MHLNELIRKLLNMQAQALSTKNPDPTVFMCPIDMPNCNLYIEDVYEHDGAIYLAD